MNDTDNARPVIVTMGASATGKIIKAGGKARYVSMTDKSAYEQVALSEVHGLLLLGGGDVNPNLYGAERDPKCYGIDDERDEAEWYALEEARTRGIPVLGICRGNQLMNVHAGGTLHQHIQRFEETHEFHQGHDARVVAVKGSRLAKAWGKREQWAVHIHHQAIKDLAPGYVASGFAHDGTIEAHEPVDGWELGVQFHPEMEADNHAHQRIFNRFVLAAARYAGLPDPVPAPPKAPAIKDATSHGLGSPVSRFKGANAVELSWRCGQCQIRFDKRNDYQDHMEYLHEQLPDYADYSGDAVAKELVALERGKR